MIARTIEITEDRVRALIDAYGADPDRWPEGERDAALTRIASDPTLRSILDDARALDTLLDAAPMPEPSPSLRVALKLIPERQRGTNWFGWLGIFTAPWQPAAGLAAAGILGLWVGVTQPNIPTPFSPVDTQIAANEFGDDDPLADAVRSAIGAGNGDLLP